MKVAFKIPNRLDTGRKIYTCSICDSFFNWGEDSSWFGSYKQMHEDPKKLKYYCSEKCKKES